ncbi:uncharacterized protein JCM6883_001250 [Sporobolomyces salmoneus]|uniref:uncharacterized protein n=1 Tax=Sporobolomyces salmoneus TaxID=183962 RepID=UPI0031721B26
MPRPGPRRLAKIRCGDYNLESLRDQLDKDREELVNVEGRIEQKRAEVASAGPDGRRIGRELGGSSNKREMLKQRIAKLENIIKREFPSSDLGNNNSSVGTSRHEQTRSSAQPRQPLPSPAPQFRAEARSFSSNTQGGGGQVLDTTRKRLEDRVKVCKDRVLICEKLLRNMEAAADRYMKARGGDKWTPRKDLQGSKQRLAEAEQELEKAKDELGQYEQGGRR